MIDLNLIFPSLEHERYIKFIHNYCFQNKFTLILKGSLSKGTASKFSDIDLIITGNIKDENVDEIIALYSKPVMTNFTENPQGILILVYSDTISVDLDIRDTISHDDLADSSVLIRYDDNFILSDKHIIRKKINSKYMPIRPEWYKTLRLVHRGLIKFLSGKEESAYDLLLEIKEKLNSLCIFGLIYTNKFDEDIRSIFIEICKKYEVDNDIKNLFESLFIELSH